MTNSESGLTITAIYAFDTQHRVTSASCIADVVPVAL